jgi:hypothetical protein
MAFDQHSFYGKPTASDIFHHLRIPKAEYAIALLFKGCGSFLVVFNLIQMLAAIQFNHELFLDCTEIDDIVADGVLPAELNISELSAAQLCP